MSPSACRRSDHPRTRELVTLEKLESFFSPLRATVATFAATFTTYTTTTVTPRLSGKDRFAKFAKFADGKFFVKNRQPDPSSRSSGLLLPLLPSAAHPRGNGDKIRDKRQRSREQRRQRQSELLEKDAEELREAERFAGEEAHRARREGPLHGVYIAVSVGGSRRVRCLQRSSGRGTPEDLLPGRHQAAHRCS